eukprot:TRINITY_DN104312_c0_g1_i1.p1 TRINITY_DN104312_c0_g1~~TRINITY_DN104312_c0_g1_i1.p1  ORF type:complete len:250 (+),score=44.87 TRINITY_DN104312_c0_g1_i1:50-799(+)
MNGTVSGSLFRLARPHEYRRVFNAIGGARMAAATDNGTSSQTVASMLQPEGGAHMTARTATARASQATFPALSASSKVANKNWLRDAPRLFVLSSCDFTTTAETPPEDVVMTKDEFFRVAHELLNWDDSRIEEVFRNIDTNNDGLLRAGEWQTAMREALGKEGGSYCTADQAEGQEAEETGYQGLLKDAQVLMQRLQPYLPGRSQTLRGFHVRGHEARPDINHGHLDRCKGSSHTFPLGLRSGARKGGA